MDSWKDENIVIIGLAKSGVAVGKCLYELGANVIVNDLKGNCPEAAELEKLGISVICGNHPSDLINETVTMVVKNPGIPYTIDPIKKAEELHIPVVTEVEIAGLLSKSPIAGITGTNGKTTTTVLVGEMLKYGGLASVVAGNIGTALTEVIQTTSEDQWIIAELSSFQLKGTKQFHPHVATLLNVGEAHLDYHNEFADYFQSKKRLFSNQTKRDFAILNADSSFCRDASKSIRSQILWFSRLHEQENGVYIKDDKIVSKINGKKQDIIFLKDVALQGNFNLENALAATAIALACNCPFPAIKKALRTFTGVEHRLEYVKTVNEIKYYNDSKATNLEAARMALETFQKPVIWLAGGLDRGIDFQSLVPIIKKKVKCIITFGETKGIFKERAKDAFVPCYTSKDIMEAVYLAKDHAVAGDVVLLSPACASWDMYTSFEERGSMFKQAVHSL